MSEAELHGSDKIYSKMMRDGLYEENITKGITERVSSEKAETEYNKRALESEAQKYMRETFWDSAENRAEERREKRAERKEAKIEHKENRKKGTTYQSNEMPEKEYEKESEVEYSKKHVEV